MRSREKIFFVLRFRLPRRSRKTKSLGPNFMTVTNRFAKQISYNSVRCISYNFCRIHRSREAAWERERIFFPDKKKVSSWSLSAPNKLIHDVFLQFLELHRMLFQNRTIPAFYIERVIHTFSYSYFLLLEVQSVMHTCDCILNRHQCLSI